MPDWLLKTEPEEYSFEDLVREKETTWTGVRNPVAIRNLFAMKKGDRLVIYHTGKVRAAVGLAAVVSSNPEPKDPKTPRVVLAAGRALDHPVSLETIKKNTLFAESPLLRIGRLSVVPLTASQYQFLSGK